LTFARSAGIVWGVTEETTRPLGEWLRQRREELGIDLEQAEADTRIRAGYLEALEAEDLDALPDPIVGRGFLRNYASYLGLSAEEATARFAQFGAPLPTEFLPAENAQPFGSEPFRPVALHDMPGFRSSRGWIVGLVAILLVALSLGAWWGGPYIIAFWNQIMPAPRPTATSEITRTTIPSATLTSALAAETQAPTATRAETTLTLEPTLTATLSPSPSATPSRPAYLGIFLELVFTDTSWIQVSVDGVRQFQGELTSGTYRSWYGEERIELRVGNAGAVLVTLNGESLGTLGAVGDVLDRIFEKVGESVTAATVTAGPSVTVTPGPTDTQPPVPGTETPTPEILPSVTLTPTVPLTVTAEP
jgi:cytoskeletal protein RodZ